MSDVEEHGAMGDHNITTETDSPQDLTAEQVAAKELEKLEEAKLRAKFPLSGLAGRPMSGHSVFLQKRLANRQKYFDSGDYQMAKQKGTVKARPATTELSYVTGEAIPTPESVPTRKTSIIQPTKFTSNTAT